MTDLLAEVDEEDFGFNIEKPVGAWSRELEVDYPGVFKALLKATVGYWTGNAPATVSSAIDAAFAFKITDKPVPPAVLAWHLVRRALARAMAKLTLEALRSDRKRPTDAKGMVSALDATLDRTAVRMDRGFLDDPAGAPILAAVKEPFCTWLKEGFGLSDAETESVARRLGAYFVFALRRELGCSFRRIRFTQRRGAQMGHAVREGERSRTLMAAKRSVAEASGPAACIRREFQPRSGVR